MNFQINKIEVNLNNRDMEKILRYIEKEKIFSFEFVIKNLIEMNIDKHIINNLETINNN